MEYCVAVCVLSLVVLTIGSGEIAPQGACDKSDSGCSAAVSPAIHGVNAYTDETLWIAGSGQPIPEMEGLYIGMPQEVSRIVRTYVHIKRGHRHFNSECGFTEFITIYDKNDDIFLVSVENFLKPKTISAMRKLALEQTWEKAQIHPDNRNPDPRKGNGFPGCVHPSISCLLITGGRSKARSRG
eukprot:m.27164 g.27164  ORF g.27164 m.27164 type:complete len:184 (+) comp7869_c0_seq2:216-767(+)